jgi:hypothetical protein
MANTRGRTRKPVPDSIDLGLRTLGFVPFEPPHGTPNHGPHTYTLMRRPEFVVQLVASNIPGDAAVTATWPKHGPERFEPDTFLRVIEGEVRIALNPTRLAAEVLASLGVSA